MEDNVIDPADMDDTNQVVTITNATKVFNETQKFPEKDAYLVSKIYKDYTDLGKSADTTELSTENVLSVFDSLMEAMDEALVPAAGRVLYVTPGVKNLLKNAEGITRMMNIQNNAGAIERNISRLDEVKIVSVPSALMKTAYDFSGEGFEPDDDAGQINMFLVHPTAIITPEKYEFAGTETPSAHTKGDYLYYEKSYEDVFIINKRANAIAFNVTFNEPVIPTVVSVSISPQTAEVITGGTQEFEATVVVEGGAAQTVNWTISGALSEGTIIEDGLLTIGADETAEEISIIATSTEDETKSDTATVTILSEPSIVSVSVSPETATVAVGGTQQFTATVVVEGEIDDSVEWTLEGALDEGTTIVDGLLTVDADETATEIEVIATSVEDSSKSDSATVTITSE